nr:hypothetical protein [uncultured Bradyrhizobium sp.]
MAMSRADTLCCAGLPGPVAIEIDRQLTAGAPNANRGPLHHLGVTTLQAAELVSQINAGAVSAHKLAAAGWNSQVARIIKQVSGL